MQGIFRGAQASEHEWTNLSVYAPIYPSTLFGERARELFFDDSLVGLGRTRIHRPYLQRASQRVIQSEAKFHSQVGSVFDPLGETIPSSKLPHRPSLDVLRRDKHLPSLRGGLSFSRVETIRLSTFRFADLTPVPLTVTPTKIHIHLHYT